MRRNENFILRQVADMTVIVPVGAAPEQFPGMISVAQTYQVERKQAEADVKAFLEKLKPAGAVDGL